MAEIYFRNENETANTPVSDGHPLPVTMSPENPVTAVGRLHETDWVQPGFGATSGAHDANDALGDVFSFSNVPRRGRILSIKMLDPDDDTLAAIIHLYTGALVGAASDAAYAVTDDYALGWVATERFDAGEDEGAFKAHKITDVNTEYVAEDGKLYAQLSTTGTPTIASQAVMPRVKLFILPLE